MTRQQALVATLKTLCKLDFYRDGNLYYITDTGFRFTVPVSEVGNGTCLVADRTITYMKWVKPQFEAAYK